VKIARENDEEKRRAHLKEFRILQQLNHPNLPSAVELFHDEVNGVVY
jgi:hypothetical protein